MKVDKIKYYIDYFKSEIAKDSSYQFAYKWDALSNFQEKWNTESDDFKKMYEESFQSNSSRALWGGERNSPKSAMIELIQFNPEFVRSAFRDLFLSDNDLMLRLNRFSYHCDELVRKKDMNAVRKSAHHHDEIKIQTVYLCFKFPELYTIFDYEAFEKTMKKLEIREMPEKYAAIRYMKLSKALYKFLLKDDELWPLVQNRLSQNLSRNEPTMLLVHDFYELIARSDAK